MYTITYHDIKAIDPGMGEAQPFQDATVERGNCFARLLHYAWALHQRLQILGPVRIVHGKRVIWEDGKYVRS